ncbi:MAG: hypothetical protein SFU98_00325 [Leptospiraceae bacterium]|nr:hypothetical protein [Leptospiraceae bacterium]
MMLPKTLFGVLGFVLVLSPIYSDDTEKVEKYFRKIRNSEPLLQAFFSNMPKGGDIHHHFSGSVYAENYFDLAVEKNFYVNIETGDTYQIVPQNLLDEPNIQPIQSFIDGKNYLSVRLKLITLWSIKDFKEAQKSADKHFFEAFRKFGPLLKGNHDFFLKEIKRRAILENIQYLETMLLRPEYNKDDRFNEFSKKYNKILSETDTKNDPNKLKSIFNEMFTELKNEHKFIEQSKKHSELVKSIYDKSKLSKEEEDKLVVRFQNNIIRTESPVDIFSQLFLSFQSDYISEEIVGTNLVGPEDNPQAMRDYSLQMQMFKFFKSKYPNQKFSLHAGELTLGVVPPEDLSWHINSAVREAGAYRIGHGVDVPFEKDSYSLLKYMKEKRIPVEVSLISNEFILDVKNDSHPILLYHKFRVPIVITSDDMGVLRSSLTGQYTALAKRYKKLSYKDIKGFVFNSIEFGFIDETEKTRIKKNLTEKFQTFEKEILEE